MKNTPIALAVMVLLAIVGLFKSIYVVTEKDLSLIHI